jgi:Peptidase family M23
MGFGLSRPIDVASAHIEAGSEEFSPLDARVVAPPQPVRTTDGGRHMLYEIQLVNVSPRTVQINAITVRNSRTKRIVASWSGDAVTGVVSQPGNPATNTLGPREAGTAFLNVTLRKRGGTPKRLYHQFAVTVDPPPTNVVFDAALTGAPTPVIDAGPIQLGPPVRGAGYFDANGCCGVSPHTRALQGIETTSYLSQRYAIDWIKLDSQGNFYNGDFSDNNSHYIFGTPLIAVADARVADTLDSLPENTPGTAATYPLTPETALGNHVILDLGGGEFALYAHMETGSVRVHRGQIVRRGQVLGLAGNTGNSDAPHLHFQVMSEPDAFASNGLPYVFDSFRLTGLVTNVDELQQSFAPATLIPASGRAQRHRVLPLEGNVVTFGG